MKKILLLVMLSLLLMAPCAKAQVPIVNLITTAVKKVIRAIDLQIQRQQNKVIWLQNAQKTIENEMTKLKLHDIADWTEKQRKLYDNYFKELQTVKNILSTYRKTKGIIALQMQLVNEYNSAWHLLKTDTHFTPQELDEMYLIYSGILDESLKNLDQLYLVINSFQTQMTDGKRLQLINTAGDELSRNLQTLRAFNRHNFQLSIARSKTLNEADMLRKLYGLAN